MFLPLAQLAVLLALGSAGAAIMAGGRMGWQRNAVLPLLFAAGALAAWSGGAMLLGAAPERGGLPLGLPWLSVRLELDALSGLFLLLIGALVMPVAIYARGYLMEFAHGNDSPATLGFFSGLFVAGMMMVVLAADAFGFMVAWELMSLSSYFLVAFQHEQAANRRASFLYLLMAHLGALAILLAFGVLAMQGEGFAFSAMREATLSPGWATIAFLLALVGFGMKAGLFPFHAWLPEAHPVAPSHISALMSGVMLKVALYGFLRVVLDLIGWMHWGWGVTLLVVGGITALYGVILALQQRDIKRMLAWSSMENLGIVFMALGLALVFASEGLMPLAGLALAAALYHALNHALFKGLLFMGAGAVLFRTHERDLDRLGGLLRRMPWTGWLFLVGVVSISALPPFNGFVSEWLVFQSALQGPAVGNGVLSTLITVSAAVLALTGALAAAVFVGGYGSAFLGQPRTRPARRAREVDASMRLGMLLPALGCLLLGVLASPVIGVLQTVTQQLFGVRLEQATAHGWLWLTPVSAETASYAPPLVLAGLLVVWAAVRLVPAVTRARTRRDAPWDCGFGPLTPRMQYSATSYAMPARRLFAPVLGLRQRFEDSPSGGKFVLQVEDRSWLALYEPVARRVQWLARRIGFLQSGSIRVYLGYSFLTLVVLLWLVSLT